MAREVVFQVPTHPGQFDPARIRPRVLLGLSVDALARWLAAYLVPYPRLLADHGTDLSFTTIRLDRDLPHLRLTDADWLTVSGSVTVGQSANDLRLSTRFGTRPSGDSIAWRDVAAIRADIRIAPGPLPQSLFALFAPDEIHEPDHAAPPESDELRSVEIIDVTGWEIP